jgi:hypothetical protein
MKWSANIAPVQQPLTAPNNVAAKAITKLLIGTLGCA